MKIRWIFKADSWGREDISVGGLLPVQVCSSVLSLEKKKARHCGAGEGFLVLSDGLSGLIVESQGPVRDSVSKMRWTAPEELCLS